MAGFMSPSDSMHGKKVTFSQVVDQMACSLSRSTSSSLSDLATDDVKLAVQMYADQNLTSPPTRDILLETARTKNAVPLPIPRATSGMRLPPERHCLTACNYR